MLTIDARSELPSPSMTNVFHTLNSSATNSVASTAFKSAMSSTQESTFQPPSGEHRHIWIVTGPAGCGKSTVAAFLARELHMHYIEGDDYHPASNRQKMTQGIPLTDVDRWDWLISLRDAAVAALTESPAATGVIVTCSALKRKYRDVIRVAAYNNHAVRVHFLYLHATEEVLLRRVAARQGHFMGVAMVHSQFQSLEVPGPQEVKDVITCDCSGDIVDVEMEILAAIRAELQADSRS